MPQVEREEFMNVGSGVYCAKQKFSQRLSEINEDWLVVFCGQVDIPALTQNLQAFERICAGGTIAGPIGQLDIASRFRLLTATRSTVLQSSKVHPGFCVNAGETLIRLYRQLVL